MSDASVPTLRPGMGLLLDVLRGNPLRPMSAAAVEELLELAREQRMLPYVAARLSSMVHVLPETAKPMLADLEREGRLAAFLMTAELKGVLRAFAAASIDVIPLKGPYFAARVYGDTRLRAARDFDLLVRGKQLTLARQTLAELGFALSEPDTGYHECWMRGATLVELHRDVSRTELFDFDIESAWGRALPDVFLDQPVLRLSPADELVYTCLHGTKHYFARLGYVLDVALLLRHIVENGPEFLQPSAFRRQLKPLHGVLLLGCELALKLDPGLKLPFTLPVTGAARREIAAMADEQWHDLVARPPFTPRLRVQRRFLRRTSLTRRGRARHRLINLRDSIRSLMEIDDEMADKIGTEFHAVRLVRFVRMFRPLFGFSKKPH